MSPGFWRDSFLAIKRVAVAALLLTAALALFWRGGEIVALFSSADSLRRAVGALGPWGPVGLIILSALQIVVAPVPGYLVQGIGGYLFGAWPGGVYGVIGLLMGASLAFALARRFGRPLLARLVPARFIEDWLRLRNVNSLAAWIIILLLPVGDFCYFLAGLTALPYSRMVLATALVRGPTVFLASYVGAQATAIPSGAVWLLALAIVALSAIILLIRDRMVMPVYDRLLMRVLGKREESNGTDSPANS